MSYTEVIYNIEKLPHYREYTCKKCGGKQKVYILEVYAICENCNAKSKMRGFASIGSEVEDVIDAMLGWIGDGEKLNKAMERKKVIDSNKE